MPHVKIWPLTSNFDVIRHGLELRICVVCSHHYICTPSVQNSFQTSVCPNNWVMGNACRCMRAQKWNWNHFGSCCGQHFLFPWLDHGTISKWKQGSVDKKLMNNILQQTSKNAWILALPIWDFHVKSGDVSLVSNLNRPLCRTLFVICKNVLRKCCHNYLILNLTFPGM